MPLASAGLHHVTAIAIDPQANLDFYSGALGLRLLKNTVNFDAPDVYHFYFGDKAGRPGSILTFFPFVYAARGRTGAGTTEATAFAVPEARLEDWMVRLAEHGVETTGPLKRFGETLIRFADPDGLALEIVGGLAPDPSDPSIAGLSSVTLRVAEPERTARVLTDVLGYAPSGEEAGIRRFSAASGAPGRHVDLVDAAGAARVQPGGGTVHHIAFRARDRAELAAWRDEIAASGLAVTDVRDRSYFESIYFREPGGVLFEIATDPPGFAIDEPAEALGTSLKLPAQYEPMRRDIERRLPPVILPHERRR